MPSLIHTVHDKYHPVPPYIRRAELVADVLMIPLKVWHLSREYEVLMLDGDYALSSPKKIHSKAILIASIVLFPLSVLSVIAGLLMKFILQESCLDIKQKFSYPLMGPYRDPYREVIV